MEKNSKNFSVQEAMRLAKTDAGKQLLSYLQQQNSKQLNKAMAQAAQGDYTQLQNTLAALMELPEAQALLKQMGG